MPRFMVTTRFQMDPDKIPDVHRDFVDFDRINESSGVGYYCSAKAAELDFRNAYANQPWKIVEVVVIPASPPLHGRWAA